MWQQLEISPPGAISNGFGLWSLIKINDYYILLESNNVTQIRSAAPQYMACSAHVF